MTGEDLCFLDAASPATQLRLPNALPPLSHVYARFQSGGWDNDVDDHAHCVLTFANGVGATITTTLLPNTVW